jgi:hypothetical protein
MKWEVQLTGDAADLRMLNKSFNEPDVSISEASGQFVLRSTEFDLLCTSRAVRNKAQEIVTAISSTARLLLGAHQPIELGAVFEVQEDGRRYTFIFPAPATLRLRGTLFSIVIKRADGTEETHYPAEPGPHWVKAALQHEVVARALRLRDIGDLEWVDLYRLYEVIASDVPAREMQEKAWVLGRQIDLFKRTANSQKAIGDKARHGKDPYDPPKNPMSLSEARALIDSVLKAWLREKASGSI